VRRFIFLSFIKVSGEGAQIGVRYLTDDVPAPINPYGVSKLEAEQTLPKIGFDVDMDIFIIRPLLVYGPDLKANCCSGLRCVATGVFLRFGGLSN
jgi:UDP-glucose 4-epimerase